MTSFSNSNQIRGDSSISSNFRECLSKFDADFGVFLFIDQIGKQSRKKVIKNFCIYKPFMTNFPSVVLFFSRILKASVSFVEVINQWFKSVHHEHSQSMSFVSWSLDAQTPFSIYDSSKICKFSLSPFHKRSCFSVNFNTLATKCKGDRERLNFWDFSLNGERYAIV